MRALRATAQACATWGSGLVRRRPGGLALTGVGIALAVALLAVLGTFIAASRATMTARAADTVAVDWQVEVQPDGDVAEVARRTAEAPHVAATETVDEATTDGLQLSRDGSTQTTGPGRVLGISTTYRATFPGQLRQLVGAEGGVLLLQQTAANLGARPGDPIAIRLAGLAPVVAEVAGVVDAPQADSLFQVVGAPPGAQPQAPPDNVVIVPVALWHQWFDALSAARPDLVHTQVHVRHDHQLAGDPVSAYREVTGQARNLEVALGGTGMVGDNLGAALDAARTDALYAQVLFLFLGAPGAVLAGLLTVAVAAAGGDRRRREQALLRARGTTTGQLVAIASVEAAIVGFLGSAGGLGLARLLRRWTLGGSTAGHHGVPVLWSAAAGAAGLAIAAVAITLPARRDARRLTVAAARLAVGSRSDPAWMRWGVDVLLLAGAAIVFVLTSRGGYQLVLAPEGVPSISVSYWAFLGPALAWTGAGLLTYRLTTLMLSAGRPAVAALVRPLAGGLSGTVAATLHRQRRHPARGAAIVALAAGFAASTAVFNSTYRQQAAVDAVLTNGADVTVTTSPGAHIGPSSAMATTVAAEPGVRRVEAIQHRFAYVGTDLQDLYGVDPMSILGAGRLQDAWFQGGSAAALMRQLDAQPDRILVSAETVRDFQLAPGDQLVLRLPRVDGGSAVDVPFHYVGVAKEFPTAPSDSFLVANGAYVARMTGDDAVGALLVDTVDRDVSRVADALRRQLGTSAVVTDIASQRRITGSSLTAVDLRGLTRVELGFALALAAAATGLTMGLDLDQRRRSHTIATALGANPRQLGSFVWAEAAVVTVAGLTAGAVIGGAMSTMLVKVLQGLFDPAPDHLAVPATYLTVVAGACVASAALAARTTIRLARQRGLGLLRAT